MFKQTVPSTGKIYQEDFLKVAVLKGFTKETMSSSFIECPVHCLISAKSQQKRNAYANCSKC